MKDLSAIEQLIYWSLAVCHNISMPIRWHKMYWKESLVIKGSAIYPPANCPCILLHFLIQLLYIPNIILRLFFSVIIRIDRNVWLECMVISIPAYL